MITGVDSAEAKIVRAKEHLKAINSIIHSIASRTGSYEIIQDTNGKETVNFLIQPPTEVAILAGEVVYQLRSALDHLAFELVKSNQTGDTLPHNWEENCLLPLCFVPPKKGTAYNCFSKRLPCISKDAFAFIESLQPYHTGTGHHNVMRIIAKLCNIDKHRYLNVILPRVAVRHDYRHASGSSGASVVGGFKHGAEVQSLFITVTVGDDPIVDMQKSFLPYITFDEPTVGEGPATLESQHVLDVCMESVQNVIVPRFVQLLENP